MNIYYTSKFERAFRKLPKFIQKEALKKEQIFRKDAYNPCLRTHRLKGKLDGYYSFSVDYSYRILFEYINNNDILFLNIGDHKIYK